jgi:selenocysteine lyase/cysteine desulfurase
VAADYARGWGLGEIRDRVYGLANELRRRLAALPGVTVRDLGVERCGIVTLTAAGHPASAIQQALRERAINATVSRLTSTRLDMEARGLSELLRVSVHYYNSEEEIERLVAALREVLRR